MSIKSYEQSWNKLKSPSLTGGDSIDHQSLFGAGDYTHDYIDDIILGITKSYASTFPAGITFANTVALKFENNASASDGQILEDNANVLKISCSGGVNIKSNNTSLSVNDGEIIAQTGTFLINDTGGDYDTRIKGDNTDNLFYIDAGNDRIGIGTATPSSILHIVGNLTMDSGAVRNIRFGNNCGDTGGIVFGETNYTNYNSRIFDDSNLYICTDDTISFADLNAVTGVKGNVTLSMNMDSLTSTFYGPTIFNENGSDVDVRMEGDTEVNCFFLDASTNRIGIRTSSPATALEVRGKITFSYNGSNYGRLESDSNGNAKIISRGGSAAIICEPESKIVVPSTDKDVHLGLSGMLRWDNVYADDFVNESGIYDDFDDVEIIKSLQHKMVDNKGKAVTEKVHEYDIPKRDYSKVHPVLQIRSTTVENKIDGTSINKTVDVLCGAIVQLEERINKQDERIKILETKLLDRG